MNTYILLHIRIAGVTQLVLYTAKVKTTYEVHSQRRTLKECVSTFNRTNAIADEGKKQVKLCSFIPTELRQKTSFSMNFVTPHLQKTLKGNLPKLQYISLTSASAVHRLFSIYRNHQCLGIQLNPEQWGRIVQEENIHRLWTILLLDPDEIIKFISCN